MKKQAEGLINEEMIRITIETDELAENPRTEDEGNLGVMVCWHTRYNLGDEHSYNSPREFLESLAEDNADTEVGIRLLENKEIDELTYAELMEMIQETNVILPLNLFDHSGLKMSTSSFSDAWDSGQVGWIYASKGVFLRETGYSEAELFSPTVSRIPMVLEDVKVKDYEEKEYGVVTEINEDMLSVDFDFHKYKTFKKEENHIITTLDRIVGVRANQAEALLEGEVETYSKYLEGEVYFYKVEKIMICNCCGTEEETEELDSCGGFYGNDTAKNGMSDHVPEEYMPLLRQLA